MKSIDINIKKSSKLNTLRFRKLYPVILFSFLVLPSFLLAIQTKSQDSTNQNEIIKSVIYEREVVNIGSTNIGYDYIYNNTGTASWYGKKFHLKKTANGELFNMYEYTAAHRDLPFGTILKVTNLDNNLSVLVRINDRGPFIGNRILDLSYSSSVEIGNTGISKVLIEGFVPGRLNLPVKSFDDYYFGYSIISALSCLNKSDVVVIGFSKDFNEAVKLYKNYLTKHPDKNSYIAIPSELLIKKEKMNDRYYIIVIDPRNQKKYKEIVKE